MFTATWNNYRQESANIEFQEALIKACLADPEYITSTYSEREFPQEFQEKGVSRQDFHKNDQPRGRIRWRNAPKRV